MPHLIEPASSGRAKCRGCGEKIAKGELRFGEVTENPYGEGDRTLWFHPICGAYKRPEPFVEAMAATLIEGGSVADIETIETPAAAGETVAWLRDESRVGLNHRRLPRIDGAGRAPTGRARCRSCREPIAKDSWRIGLVFYEEGYFNPSGFIHAGCWRDYLKAEDAGSGEPLDQAVVLARLAHFSPELTPTDLAEIDSEFKNSPP
jgi:hypothetical protein